MFLSCSYFTLLYINNFASTKFENGFEIFVRLSIHNWVYIFFLDFFDPYSDVLYSEECQAKSLSNVVKC